jgi:hypothetical protein
MDAGDYSVTGESSVIPGVEFDPPGSAGLLPPNPYGDLSRRRRPRAGKAPSVAGDSKTGEPASVVSTGGGESIASGEGWLVRVSGVLVLGFAVMKDGSSDGAGVSTPPSLGCEDSRYGRKSRGRLSRPCRLSR